jgi:hypothetical protein
MFLRGVREPGKKFFEIDAAIAICIGLAQSVQEPMKAPGPQGDIFYGQYAIVVGVQRIEDFLGQFGDKFTEFFEGYLAVLVRIRVMEGPDERWNTGVVVRRFVERQGAVWKPAN